MGGDLLDEVSHFGLEVKAKLNLVEAFSVSESKQVGAVLFIDVLVGSGEA
jgi:hypothetical protein